MLFVLFVVNRLSAYSPIRFVFDRVENRVDEQTDRSLRLHQKEQCFHDNDDAKVALVSPYRNCRYGFFFLRRRDQCVSHPGQVDQSKTKKWQQTDSGLQYLDMKEGTGDSPKRGQICLVQYTGWLWENNTKGKEFDSSVGSEPISFPVGVGQVIKGWDEGIATMKVGGKRELLIPAKLGYGAEGASGAIPPNATLLFEVELLNVMKQTDSGLQYLDVQKGEGATPKPGQTCVVHYTGWLWQDDRKGRKFDSSVAGEAARVCRWDEERDRRLGRGRRHYEGRRQAAMIDSSQPRLRCRRIPPEQSPAMPPCSSRSS